MNTCQGCGIEIPADQQYCPICQAKLAEHKPITPQPENKPEELSEKDNKFINGFSWGAAVGGVVYIAAMDIMSYLLWVWIAVFIAGSFTYGLLDIILFFWLGIVGRREAWKCRKWKSFEEFKSTQQLWDRYGKIILILCILVIILAVTFTIKAIT